jgi:hypothetical protein
MATTIQPPKWEQGEGPRILIEASEWAEREHLSRLLGAAGYQTASCPGPEGADQPCPLSMTGTCPAVDDADLVIHLLRHTDARNRHVLLSLRQHYGQLPLVVYAPDPTVQAFPEDFEGAVIIRPPLSSKAVLDSVEEALR